MLIKASHDTWINNQVLGFCREYGEREREREREIYIYIYRDHIWNIFSY